MVSKVLLFAFGLLSVLAEISEEDSVWVLTDSNFEEALDLQPDLLVEFYAPWCGHCKNLAPEYAKAAKTLLKNDPPIRIAKVDVTANKDLGTRFDIQGFPTIKYFKNKSATEYTGGRTEDTIVSWVLRKTQPTIKVLSNLEGLEKSIGSSKVVAVLFGQRESESFKIFNEVSSEVESVAFVLSTGSESLAKYNLPEGSISLFTAFNKGRNDFTGDLTTESLKEFIELNRLPSVVDFDQEAIERIFKDSNPVVFLFSADHTPYAAWFEALSKENKGRLIFCKADLDTTDNGRLSQFLGLKGDSQPTSLILDPTRQLAKYRLEADFSEDSVRDFINSWKDDKLTPYLKSQPIPEEKFENNVRIVVAKNFDEVVNSKKKDVLLEFYAPWCGHCKKLAPEYERLAANLKKVKTVVVAKIDGTENEVPGEEIKGFPTIRFYPANNKKHIEFEGEQSHDALLEFIKSNSYYQIEEENIGNIQPVDTEEGESEEGEDEYERTDL